MESPSGARATFADLGVGTAMVRSLADRGIRAPFPVQAAALPDLLAGRDVCGRAPTGSGKTLAFGIPLVTRVQEAGRARPKRPLGLVLVPTRELAAQVCKELQLLAKPRGPWVEAFYGGTAFPRQVNALRRGVDIAVACPGRLADLINQGCVDLSDVAFVVVDEADRMADMGFLPEVRRILDQCGASSKDRPVERGERRTVPGDRPGSPGDRPAVRGRRGGRQTVLFSATLDGAVQVLIDRYMHDPARHEVEPDDAELRRATHLFWKVEAKARVDTAAALVHHHGPTVVFCRTKRGADRVTRQLESAGVRAAAIHGDRSQAQRERALRSFHKGHVSALVATDVAARGIHVDGIACVIHYDPPADHKDYVHRSGRTARAGAKGVVVSLVVPPVRSAVSRLQRDLELPAGLTPPDLTGLRTPPEGPSGHTQPTERRRGPRRARPDRPYQGRPGDDRPRQGRATSKQRPKTTKGRPGRSGRANTTNARPGAPATSFNGKRGARTTAGPKGTARRSGRR